MIESDNRQTAASLRLVQDLTGRLSDCASIENLLEGGFRILYETVGFDVAVAVTVEQNLDLYISGRKGAESQADDRLTALVRKALESIIPASFAGSDFVVRSEHNELPPVERSRDSLRHEVHAALRQKNRASGTFVICREEEFTHAEGQILEIFATLISALLENMLARQRILALADTDELTGIPNRRYFRRQLPQEIERARVYNVPLSILMIDIDDFKEINDTFGHVMGDVVLSELCGSIRETLRSPDAISRYGGDEFAVILPHTDLSGAVRVADRILARLREVTIEADPQRSVRCSVSIGVAELQAVDETANDLVHRADNFLYEAKRQGKNRQIH